MPQKITFHKASSHWKETIFKWLEEPHVQEFWDTSKEYKNDILLFMEKRVQPSSYCNGIFDYWIAFFDNIPYALIMTSEVKHSQQDLDATWRQYLTKNGKTITLDFMIGNTNYLHRNLAGTTLNTFTEYMQELDPSIKTFLIDPDTSNIRAKHAYEKAGFIVVSTFIRHQKPHFLMVKNSFSIQKAPPTKEKEIFSFLEHHEEYSLFLMNNLISYGYVMTENPNSANFYSIFEDDDIIGFFGLTRKGILLMDCNRFEAFPWILEYLKKEQVPLKGIMGEWVACSAFWDFLKEMGFITQVTFEEKEILYSLDTGKKEYPQNKNVRILSYDDFSKWYEHNTLYFQELKLPNRPTKEELKKEFFLKVEKKIIWGLFLREELVSVAAFNAQTQNFGQIGGVYTTPSARKKGFATQLIQQLIMDARNIHRIKKLILFTNISNRPARTVYESLGAEHRGYFALLFGQSE